MARPEKKGIDYFPLDCHMDDDVRLIEAEFGIKGFAIIIKLYQKIYGENGYYLNWSQDVALLFTSDIKVSGNVVSEVVKRCLERGIFNKAKFEEYSILTSKGIQERYMEVAIRRKNSKIDDRYTLLSADKKTVNVYNNSKNVDNNAKNDSDNTQSKQYNTKQYNTKQYNIKNDTEDSHRYVSDFHDLEDDLNENENKRIYESNLFELFETEFGRTMNQNEFEIISDWSKKYDDRLIRYALREALTYDKKNIKYIDKILYEWYKKGLTPEKYENGER